MRIAMWSGPRNLSTAMMYAFDARGDCAVVDEPFYAAYLARTGLDHPMRADILATGNPDPASVGQALSGPVPDGKPHYYQKHMVHHIAPDQDLSWAEGLRHVFLIRHPARVISSYVAKRENPGADDLGFARQAQMFDLFRNGGQRPIVIDATAIRADPRGMLHALCAALDLPFSDRMLSWPAGGNPNDGVWAAHWYGAVHRSTGFAGPEPALPTLDHPLLADALAQYDRLRAVAITPTPAADPAPPAV